MELIGQPPTESKRYEMLRRNVKNPHLSHLVVQLSLLESRKISLDGFFEDCNHYSTFSTTWRKIPAVNARLRRFFVAP